MKAIIAPVIVVYKLYGSLDTCLREYPPVVPIQPTTMRVNNLHM